MTAIDDVLDQSGAYRPAIEAAPLRFEFAGEWHDLPTDRSFIIECLRGGPGKLATNRRARLVEYAVTSQVVTRADLPLLDAEALRGKGEAESD